MQLIAEIGFDQSFSFIYSPRPGTPAATLPDAVPDEEKHAAWSACRSRSRTGPGDQPGDGRYGAARAGRAPVAKDPAAAGRTTRTTAGSISTASRRLIGPVRGCAWSPKRWPIRCGAASRCAGRRHASGNLQRHRPSRSARRSSWRTSRQCSGLANLCGQFDENLRQIERAAGIEISHRGNQLSDRRCGRSRRRRRGSPSDALTTSSAGEAMSTPSGSTSHCRKHGLERPWSGLAAADDGRRDEDPARRVCTAAAHNQRSTSRTSVRMT